MGACIDFHVSTNASLFLQKLKKAMEGAKDPLLFRIKEFLPCALENHSETTFRHQYRKKDGF